MTLTIDILDAIKTKLATNTSYVVSIDENTFYNTSESIIMADLTKIYILVTDDKMDLSNTTMSGHCINPKGEISVELNYSTKGKTVYQYRKTLEEAINNVMTLLLDSSFPQGLGIRLFSKESVVSEGQDGVLEVSRRILTFTYEKL